MKIQDNNNKPDLVHFSVLCCGNVFRYNNNICMKISTITDEYMGKQINAIDLWDGGCFRIGFDDLVENLTERAILTID